MVYIYTLDLVNSAIFLQKNKNHLCTTTDYVDFVIFWTLHSQKTLEICPPSPSPPPPQIAK
jgi:hypothetical protein